jgi:hypothetical protein
MRRSQPVEPLSGLAERDHGTPHIRRQIPAESGRYRVAITPEHPIDPLLGNPRLDDRQDRTEFVRQVGKPALVDFTVTQLSQLAQLLLSPH